MGTCGSVCVATALISIFNKKTRDVSLPSERAERAEVGARVRVMRMEALPVHCDTLSDSQEWPTRNAKLRNIKKKKKPDLIARILK